MYVLFLVVLKSCSTTGFCRLTELDMGLQLTGEIIAVFADGAFTGSLPCKSDVSMQASFQSKCSATVTAAVRFIRHGATF